MFTMRTMTAADRATWARMRAALWPDDTLEGHARALDEMLAAVNPKGYWAFGFIAETADGIPAGFAEVAIRNYANGCESQPVPFLEGIWVEPLFRRQGAGAQLMAHVETFLTARGFREIGSDAFIDNDASHAAHRAWGFAETERIVYFRKALGEQ
jgi:aminoglycoside 6'-N-acetyltransferase I